MLTRFHQPAIRLLAPSTHPLHPQCLHPIRPRVHLPSLRLFTSTRALSDNAPVDHYAILKVPPDCTKAELKKRFYVLSKETHPDINPNDPGASLRFSQISESYSVLADPDKRRRYDRDFARTHQSSSPSARTRGASYAGSRPASGLSKRRGAFRGPPPSFYRNGNTSASSASSSSTAGQGGTFNASAFSDETFDFDSTSTFKTQTHEDARRQTRRAAEMAAAAAQAEDEGDFWARFVVVTGVLVLGITVATIIAGMGPPKGGLMRGDGSRRNGKKNEWTNGG